MVRKESGIIYKRLVRSYLSSVISISLVLVMVGVAALVMVNAGAVSDYLKENIKVSVELSMSADETSSLSIAKKIENLPGVKSVMYISKEQGIREMERQLGPGFLDVFPVPPIPVSLEVGLDADYLNADSLQVMKSRLAEYSGVADVYCQESVMEMFNDNIEKIGAVLALFILLMMFVSFVLIGNTVRLNLYSKRFTIYTMQLVGATKAFIRRPFVMQAFFQGVISGMVAVVAIVGIMLLVKREFHQLLEIVRIQEFVCVLCFVVVVGVLICMFSTVSVVNRLVGYSKDELYLG